MRGTRNVPDAGNYVAEVYGNLRPRRGEDVAAGSMVARRNPPVPAATNPRRHHRMVPIACYTYHVYLLSLKRHHFFLT